MGRPGQGLEPLRGDAAAAPDARPERPVVEPGEGGVDRREVLLVLVAQGEVALLLEDLTGGRGLGAIGHRVRRDDALREPGEQARAFGQEGGASVRRGRGHGGWIVRERAVRPDGLSSML